MKKRMSRLMAATIAVRALTFTPLIHYLPHISIIEAKVQTYEDVGEDYASELESQTVHNVN